MLSIFTPTHSTKYLMELYNSIKNQPFDEWVVVYNNGAKPLDFGDTRVRAIVLGNFPPYVGALKAYACEQCKGDILLEVDHDDLLAPNAIEEVLKAFADPSIGFVYSNDIRCDMEYKPEAQYGQPFGWKYRTTSFAGHKVDECVAFPPTTASVSRIWYAPDHLRAFRKSIYQLVGGYNAGMRVLDDQDLMARLFQHTKFKHIDKPLYVYRIHRENTWKDQERNKEIQENVMRLYQQYREPMLLAECSRNKLLALDLGGAFNKPKGYLSVDMQDADYNCNLEERWPFEDNSVGVLRCYDILEHLKDKTHAFKEASRVLVPGGWMLCQVPSTDGRGAFQDPTHISYWNENSFLYYTDKQKAQYIRTPVRFQAVQLYTTPKNEQQVCWVIADLINLKDGYRPPGLINI